MSQYIDAVLKSLVVLKEMLTDRGVDADMISRISEDEVRVLCNQTTIFHIRLPVIDIVYFLVKPGLRDMRDNISSESEKYLFITKDPTPPVTIDTLTTKDFPDKDIQFFTLKELQFNVSRHELQPSFEVIRDEKEIEAILQSYQVKSRVQLPIMLKTDAIARYLDAKPRNLVKITRSSPSAAEYVCYRCCM